MPLKHPVQQFKGNLIVLGFNLVVVGMLMIGALAGPPGRINSIAIPTSGTPVSETVRFHGNLLSTVVYGERVLWSSAIRQPWSRWPNLFNVFLGLGLLLTVEAASGHAKSPENSKQGSTFYSITYGCLLSFLGSGSMFFHGWMTDVGGIMDIVSMYIYVTFVVAYNLCWLSRCDMDTWLARLACFGSALGATLLLAVAVWVGDRPGSRISLIIFTALILSLVASEVFILYRTNGIWRPEWWWFALGAGAFFLAFAVWIISQTRGTFLYHPDSAFQGHAVWHVLAATTAFCFYLYYRSETRLSSSPSQARSGSKVLV
jgi:hypothetical protein